MLVGIFFSFCNRAFRAFGFGVAASVMFASAASAGTHTIAMQAIVTHFAAVKASLGAAPPTDDGVLKAILATPGLPAATRAELQNDLARLSVFEHAQDRISAAKHAEINRLLALFPKSGPIDVAALSAKLAMAQTREAKIGNADLAQGLAYTRSLLANGAGTIYSPAFYDKTFPKPVGTPPTSLGMSLVNILIKDGEGALTGAAAGATGGLHGAAAGAATGAIVGSGKELISQITDALAGTPGPTPPAGAQVAFTSAKLYVNGSTTTTTVHVGAPVTFGPAVVVQFLADVNALSCKITYGFQTAAATFASNSDTATITGHSGNSQTLPFIAEGSWPNPTEVRVTGTVTCGPVSKDTNAVDVTVVK